VRVARLPGVARPPAGQDVARRTRRGWRDDGASRPPLVPPRAREPQPLADHGRLAGAPAYLDPDAWSAGSIFDGPPFWRGGMGWPRLGEPVPYLALRCAGAVDPQARGVAAALAAPSAPVALVDGFRVRTPGVRSPQAHLRVPGRALCPAGPSGGPAAPRVGA